MKLTIQCIIICVLTFQTAEAQIWKKIKKKAEDRIERKAEEKMDDILNGKEKEEKKHKEDSSSTSEIPSENESEENKEAVSETKTSEEVWRNYKFIPGEKVIFYDNLEYEEVGEFPSRWDLVEGGAEIGMLNGEKVIIGVTDYYNKINPLFDNINYLSDEFTIEYDVYIDDLSREFNNSWADYNIFFDSKNIKGSSPTLDMDFRSGKLGGHIIEYGFQIEEVSLGALNSWHHVAMSYYKGKFKLYYDGKRVANLPRIKVIPDIFTIDMRGVSETDEPTRVAIKNIRIAHGGGQMYKRIMSEGKYTTNGILFDSGKSTIKPQSMGVINKVVSVLRENQDWKFMIVGHTDTDGTEESNLKLSKDRAEAIKNEIIARGIDADRLTIVGKGQSEPVSNNKTPEGKANNRRVEFIKL